MMMRLLPPSPPSVAVGAAAWTISRGTAARRKKATVEVDGPPMMRTTKRTAGIEAL
jgi:hypothetical protein